MSSDIALAYGFLGSNLGDVAITKGALALLQAAGVDRPVRVVAKGLNTRLTRSSWARVRSAHPNARFQAWDHGFASFRSEHSPTEEFVKALIDSREVRQHILASAGLNAESEVIYSGGENLFSHGTAEDDWNLFGRLALVLAAQAEGLATGFLPCTFGPFDSEVSRYLIQRALSSASFVLVRDAFSERQVEQWCSPIRGADCAFFTGNAVSGSSPPRRWGKRIALVPRLEGAGLRAGRSRTNAYLEDLKVLGLTHSSAFRLYFDIGRELLTRGRYIRLLTQCDADVDLNKELYVALQPLAKHANQVALSRPANTLAYHRVLATCGGVITSRLHTAIFALQNGVVPIALYFDIHGHKTPGVFSLLGLEEFCMTADEFRLDMLMPKIAQARATWPEAAKRISALQTQTIVAVERGRASRRTTTPRVEVRCD